MKRYWSAVVAVASLIALQSAAVTIHRSFRTREAGVGFGTGRASVVYPVDSKLDHAIDEARQKKLGLWAGENPINPYEWRKNKRRM